MCAIAIYRGLFSSEFCENFFTRSWGWHKNKHPPFFSSGGVSLLMLQYWNHVTYPIALARSPIPEGRLHPEGLADHRKMEGRRVGSPELCSRSLLSCRWLMLFSCSLFVLCPRASRNAPISGFLLVGGQLLHLEGKKALERIYSYIVSLSLLSSPVLVIAKP